MKNKLFFTFLLCLILATCAQAYTPEYDNNGQLTLLIADLSRNGDISMTDIGLLASAWLEQDCGLTNLCNEADIYPFDGEVDFVDFAVIANVWGLCTDPKNPDCVHAPLTLYEPPTSGNPDEGVQLFSGEFSKSVVDMRIGGRGLDFTWKRTYRSRTGANTAMGNRWDHSYNIYIEQYGANLIVHNGGGRRDVYAFQEVAADEFIWKKEGFLRELAKKEDGSFTMTFPDTGTWSFRALSEPNAPGKISAVTDRNGNSLNFEYDTQGRLTTVRDPLDTGSNGRIITIGYDTNNLIVDVNDWADRQIKYEYYNDSDANGSSGDLKSVTTPAVTGTPTGNNFPSGKKTIYTYSKGFVDECLNHNLLTITDPKRQTYLQNIYATNSNDPNFDHVVRRIVGKPNDIINYTYLPQTPDASNNYAVTKTITNDRMGNVTEHFFGNRNQLLILRRYTGRADPNQPTTEALNRPTGKLRSGDPDYFETRYQYNSEYLPTRIDYPNGNYLTNVYEVDIDPDTAVRRRGNLRESHSFAGSLGGDQTQIDEFFEYDPNFNFIIHYTDARRNETLHDYDPNGNRIRSEYIRPSDPNIVHQWQYNDFGQVTDHNLPDNGSNSKRRDTYTYYTNPVDPNYGYLQNVAIDANNLALTTTYEYDGVGNITRVIDPNGNDTQFIVNQLNQVVRSISREVTGGSGVRYKKETYYDENDNIIRVDIRDINDSGLLQPDPNITTTYEYDILNRLIRTTAEVNSVHSTVTEYEYDDNSNRTLTRFGEATNSNDPNNVVRKRYDERDMLFKVTRAEGDPNQSTTQYDYDGNGNVIKVHEGLEDTPRTTTSQYDGFDRLINIIDPMSNVTEYHYDPTGNVISKRIDGELTDVPGDVNNVRLSELNYEYDTINRLTRLTVAFFDPNTQSPLTVDGNSITDIYYSNNSQVIRKVDDNGNQTHYEYDTANRLSETTDAKGTRFIRTYDRASNVIEVNEIDVSDLAEPNEIFVTTYAYDNLYRLISITDNNSNTTEYRYDSRDNRRLVTDALGNETRYEYDGLNRLTRTIRDMDGDGADASDADDITTGRTYDDNSRLIEQTDDNGNTTTYQYDALNRMVRTIFADGTSETSTYDIYDDMVGSIDAIGTASVMVYDRSHRLKRGTYTPGTGVSTDPNFEDYQYDGLSRMVYAENNNSVVTRAYDSLSNTVEEVQSGRVIRSTHDGLGNKLSCTYPGGRVVTNTYDALKRKKTTSIGGTLVAGYDYIGPGRVRRLSYGNGVQNNYSYDDVKRITGTKHSRGVAIVDERSYSYDAIYNKTQRKDKRVGGLRLTHDYSYDAIYRLINTTVTGSVSRNTDYFLDGVGNRTDVVGSPDAGPYDMNNITPVPADFQMNQYTTTSFDSREYDDNGNLSTIDSSTTQKNIIYDYRNLIVEVNDVNTGQIHTYTYDALRRRIRKHTSGGGLPPATTNYFYDGARVIEEQDGTGTTLATYVYGNYIDEVLHMRRGTADTATDYYYHADDMYNVMAVTDSAGTVVERYEYGDYGQPEFFDGTGTPIGSIAIGNPYLFNGRRYDPETGWYYYRTRYLDPKAGRFISRDTIGTWGDASNLGNGSAYVGNNPWSSLDPFGLKGKLCKCSMTKCSCGCKSSGHNGIVSLTVSISTPSGGGGGSSVYRRVFYAQGMLIEADDFGGLAKSKCNCSMSRCSCGCKSSGHNGQVDFNAKASGDGGGSRRAQAKQLKGYLRTGDGEYTGHQTVLKVADHTHYGHITVLKIADHTNYGHITVLKIADHTNYGHITVLKVADHTNYGHITVLKIAGGGDHNGTVTIKVTKI